MKLVEFDKAKPVFFVVKKPVSLPATLTECMKFIEEEKVKEVELNYGGYLIYLNKRSNTQRIINEYDNHFCICEKLTKQSKHESTNHHTGKST